MKVESQAGKFVLNFDEMEPGDDGIVITGKMGLWDAKTYMSFPEFLRILGMTLRPRMFVFLIKALLTGRFRARAEGPAES
jgi:hypothetical protein